MPSDRALDPEIEDDEEQIERGETGIRILFSLLFWIVFQVVETVLAALVLFDLAFALITQREPSDRVKHFAERVIRYAVQVGRYLTYNRDTPPFPFDEFPQPPEPR